MNGKYTPGPWTVEPQYTDRCAFPIAHRIDATAKGILAEVNSQGGTPDQQRVNAELIAAAPAMFEALQEIAATQTLGRDVVWCVDTARAALKSISLPA